MRERVDLRRAGFFDCATDLFSIVDGEGRFVEVNHAWTRVLGWSKAELLAAPADAFLHPDDLAEPGRRAASEPGATCRYRANDGQYRLIEWRERWTDADGLRHGVAVDVTAARRLATQIAEIEHQARMGTWEIDLGTRELHWSAMTFAIHEVDPATFRPTVEQTLTFYPATARTIIKPALQRLMESEGSLDLELPFVTAAGRHIWVRVTAATERRAGRPLRLYGTFSDMTEERARRQELERLGEVARRTVNLVIVCDADQRIEWVNDAFERVTGYRLADVRGERPGALLQCPETDPTVVAAIRAALRQGKPARAELLNRTKDGRKYWVDIDIQPTRDADGRATGFVAVQTDVTARKEHEVALAAATAAATEARTRLLQAVEVLPDALVYYDADDRLALCNQRYRDFYPETAPAMIPGARFEDILRYGLARGQYRDAVGREAAWLAERMAAHRQPESSLEQYLADGRWLRVYERATADGGRISMRADITDLKRAQQRLADIITGARVGTWEWNVQTDELLINDRWAEIVGHTKAELEPTTLETWTRFVHPDDLELSNANIDKHFTGATDFYECEVRMRHAAGHWVWVLDRGRVSTRTADGRPEWVSGVHLDVTEQRAMEQRLLQSQRLEAIGQLTGGVAHDFNNLLTVILGNAELMEELLPPDDPVLPFVAMSRTAAERGASLTQSLLAFARRQPLDARPVDVGAVLRGMATMLKRTLGEQVVLRLDTPADLWPARIDAAQLESALLNLSLNARDAMPSGGTLAIETRNVAIGPDVADLLPGDYVMLAVADDGQGIDAETLPRVFEPFFTTKEPGKGSGLGLSMVYGYVTQLGGHVVLDSEPGWGTRVRLYLPRAVVPTEESWSDDRATVGTGGGETILLVEDDPLVRAHVAELVGSLGYTVVSAADGAAALRVLGERREIDLLFTDVVMPGGMNGRELAERARGLRPDLPVLLTSGYTADALPDSVDCNGALPILKKPYRRDKLAAKLRNALTAARQSFK